ncbi:vanillate O-demethylase monooxygenase subunit [Sphingobium sp. JAI105]|uniref:aromatic ring-hydroxylating dioxygenase subunit alpha n=1 Tax=Sphingobium sp. JAI105 TaxID=2787715 RepID=UPI0018C8E608|nr:aromatic ring-hydroxylating dioxygenase subunit alpha [Sphingobium sp. JAI105]MBG6118503.1 vanillate O-demethylase monooxygenase subunit [Sphingobium sp. JAI105]
MSGIYLLNCWYVAAWASELAPGRHLRRVLLGEPVLLLRGQSGETAAIGNVCPHRFASLSDGKFENDVVECPYHGLRFAMSGQCVHNPHGDGKIPERAKVRSYPVAEKYGAIWIWPGDPEAADRGIIPDFSFLDVPIETERAGGHLRTDANYQLLTDNILDLSHADFVHTTTLSTGGDIARCQAKAQVDGEVVSVKWVFDGKGMVMNRSAENPVDVHTEFEVIWHAPGAMILKSASRPVEAETGVGHTRVAAHIMTPETDKSTHYFFDVADRRYLDRVTQIFEEEDGVMLEQIQRNMRGEDLWDLHPAILSSDRGAVLARRTLQRKIRHEQESQVDRASSPAESVEAEADAHVR